MVYSTIFYSIYHSIQMFTTRVVGQRLSYLIVRYRIERVRDLIGMIDVCGDSMRGQQRVLGHHRIHVRGQLKVKLSEPRYALDIYSF